MQSSIDKMVPFTTDLACDNINHNSYLIVFWIDGTLWKLNHEMYRCSHFPEKHTAINIKKVIYERVKQRRSLCFTFVSNLIGNAGFWKFRRVYDTFPSKSH